MTMRLRWRFLLGLALAVPLAVAAEGGSHFRTGSGTGVRSGTWPAQGAWSGTVQPYGTGGYGYGYGTGGYGGYGGGYGGYGRTPPGYGYGWPGRPWPPGGQPGRYGGDHDRGYDHRSRNYIGDPPRRDADRHDRHGGSRYDSRRAEPYYGAPSGRHRERRSTVGEQARDP